MNSLIAFFVRLVPMIKIVFKPVILLISLVSSLNNFAQEKKQRYYHLLIGTYTKTQNKGIFVYAFDSKTGKLSHKSNTENIVNPSFLTINKAQNKVYSVSEGSTAQASSFDFDSKTGTLKLINSEGATSPGACYISLTADEKHVLTANYGGGSISIFPVNENGSIAPIVQLIKHKGSSINLSRQKSAHAHSIMNSPDGKYMYSADLGTDKLYAYKLTSDESKPLTAAKQEFVKTKAGSGPRHFTFSKNGKYLYLVGELDGSVTAYNYRDNQLEEFQYTSLNTENFKGTNGAADIHLSQDGKFLYVTNRGSVNEIVIFSVDQKTGILDRLGSQSTMGKTPRNFAIDPTDKFLLVANQDSNDIYVFKRNKKTGMLTYTGNSLNIGAPVCLLFTPIK